VAATTRADWAEHRLRTAILTGELEPGERIRIEQLAAAWHLSPTPLREAVRSLAHTGLVDLAPQRGATVAGLSPEEIAGIYELRLLLEPRALRLSLHRRDWAWRADVEAAWLALGRAWGDERRAPAHVEPAHTDFHEALAAGCGNSELLRLTRRLAAQSMRVLLLAIAQDRIEGPTLADHAELYEACVEGDVDDAMRVALLHVGRPMAARIGGDAVRAIGARIAEVGGGDPLLPEVLDTLT
jgi:GntR family transcriptional regulator, carbon starvation induced regulator